MNEEYLKYCQQAYQKILTSNNVLIVSHLHPDVDALSSVGIMIELVENLGKKYLAYASGKDDELFNFLPHAGRIHSVLPIDFSLADYDLILVLDCGSINRTGLALELNNRDRKKNYVVEFDHHPPVDHFADLEIRLPNLASATEVLYHFLKINNVVINKNISSLLLSGILTDTGNFLYPSTSDQTINIASEMLQSGAQLPKIFQNTLQNKNLASMKLWGVALKNLKINSNYNLAVSVLTNDEIIKMKEELGIDDFSSEIFGDIVGFLSNLGGVKGVILLREEPDGKIKASLRTSDPQIDLSFLAQIFGGGGHPKASGFTAIGRINNYNDSWEFEY
ncbi:MAG: bifunctional oligoribonuclease/PAP phosphatase NrnA [Patescibacteria group bacterium]|jgi:phosphoesterase RecJ-like protein